MINQNKSRQQKCYIRYNIESIGKKVARIKIIYCVYRGNMFYDINKKYSKIIECPINELEDKKRSIRNNITKTYNRLMADLTRMGTTSYAIKILMAEKMR